MHKLVCFRGTGWTDEGAWVLMNSATLRDCEDVGGVLGVTRENVSL